MKNSYLLFFLAALSFLSSCYRSDEPSMDDRDVMGWVPVYSKDANLKKIVSDTPHATIHAGKIYAISHFIYQNEVNEGIHVIDVSNPAVPKEIAFIKAAGSSELAVRGHYLYTNNLQDIVVIDISDPLHVKEIARLKNAFSKTSEFYPPEGGYFECVDPAKGTVIGWEQKTLHEPKCYR